MGTGRDRTLNKSHASAWITLKTGYVIIEKLENVSEENFLGVIA